MKQLADFIRSLVTIDDAYLQAILSNFEEKTVLKGQTVLKKGQIARQYFFIKKGGLRFFYEANNKQNTSWVVFKNEFFTEVSSLIPQRPTRFTIEAIE